ncbi:AIPR family protein [Candidatus Magnetominusculus xianensis]|uniref:Abortive infection protein n=1 Tax=Candidatus Magnetominusculus xianensis TaxID=1748249 RepID=A0ABR5SFQ0_9BACT|nr:AIPR family protein [Candidatus Magnetominusculus xianensis]KWT86775.1 abortive infection protein [Candidatus Magnetominusculus xianensis]MBF0402507.1 AIPR family protein [Nitrospirota bacterium]
MSILQAVIEANLDNIRGSLPEKRQDDDPYAFLIFAMMSLLGITINEAIFSATDGSGDGGIDAIYIDETGDNIIINIFQSKYRTNLAKGIGKNEIDLTIAKVEEIFQGHKVDNQSEIMKTRIEEIRDIIKDKGRLKPPEKRIYFVVNTHKPEESEKERAKMLEAKGNYHVSFHDGNDILQAIDNSKQRVHTINIITYKDILYLGTDKKLGDVRGMVATISAEELVHIYESAGHDKVLSRNIRYYLGNNKINREIKETASSPKDSKYFWFLNNGVTISCDQFSFTDDALGNKIIEVTNPKIINGAQTTKSLYDLYAERKTFPNKQLQDIHLLLRLYETRNEALIDKITVGTNTQNPIFERDLKANAPVQKLVKDYFLEKGFHYETHRNEYMDKKIDKAKIANNERVFQAYISLYKEMPHEAKSCKSKIFEKYFDDVFVIDDKELPNQLLISFKLLSFLEHKAKESREQWNNGDIFLQHADLALVYIAGKVYPEIKDNGEILQNNKLLNDIYSIEVSILREIIQCENKVDDDYSHNNFFKSRTFRNLIERMSKEFLTAAAYEILTGKQGTDINVITENIVQSIRNYYRKRYKYFYGV